MVSEKTYNWVVKHLFLLLLVLVVAIIPLYIVQFKEFFDDANIKILSLLRDILLVVGAIISTYFLYLTFQQARIANELKIYETSFEEFSNQIVKKENMIVTSVFSDAEEEIFTNALQLKQAFSGSHIWYSYFVLDISSIVELLPKRTKYSDCVKLLGEKYDASISVEYFDLDEIRKTCEVVYLLYRGLGRIVDYYLKLYALYESIDKSSLQESQKVILLTKLNKILDEEYQVMLCAIFDEPIVEKGYNQDLFKKCNEIKNTVFFEFYSPNLLLRYARVFVDIRPEYDYRKIKAKHNFNLG